MVKPLTYFALFTLLGSLLFGLNACDKDDEGTPKSLLTGKQWKLTSWISNPPYEVEGQMISNIYTLLPACSQDDFVEFDTDGSMIKDKGEEKCNEFEPQTVSGTWLLSNDQSILRTSFDNDETDYGIGEISDNFLILNRQEVIEQPTGTVSYYYVITYTRM
jgi:hypothetical protein